MERQKELTRRSVRGCIPLTRAPNQSTCVCPASWLTRTSKTSKFCGKMKWMKRHPKSHIFGRGSFLRPRRIGRERRSESSAHAKETALRTRGGASVSNKETRSRRGCLGTTGMQCSIASATTTAPAARRETRGATTESSRRA
eukprot:Rmarinus@m.12679